MSPQTLPSRQVHADEFRMPTLRDLIGPVFRYWRPAGLVFLAVMAAAFTVALMSTRTYKAEMKILVNRERMDTVLTSDPQSPAASRVEVSETELYSELEVLTSRDVLEQVAAASGLLGRTARNADVPQEMRLALAVASLRGDLNVRPLRKTTMISVGYASSDPQLAARVLQELARVYLEKHLALHRPAGARQFFSDQVAKSEADLRAAETRLNEFGEREQVVSAFGERETTLQKLSEFESTLQQHEASIADTGRRLAAIDAELATTPSRQVTSMRDANTDVIRTLKAQLLQLELKRSELLQKFTPQYPPVVQVDDDISRVQAALADAEHTPLRDQTTDQNPTYQWLANERARVRTERDALLARAGATRRTVAEYRERARRLDTQNIAQQELLRQVKAAEANYLLYQRKQEEARISDELDKTRIANVALAEPPTRATDLEVLAPPDRPRGWCACRAPESCGRLRAARDESVLPDSG